MRASPRRKFGLLDAMILVAAASVGALSLRLFQLYGLETLNLYRGYFPGYEGSAYVGIVVKLVSPWLAAFSTALLILRLRGGRPPLVRMLRQPGATASLAATAVLAATGLLAAVDIAILGVPPSDDFYYKFMPLITEGAGSAVGAVWLVQALGRRWRPEPSWIDRAGRVLGLCWILVVLAGKGDSFWFTSMELRQGPAASSTKWMAKEMRRQEKIQKQIEKLLEGLEPVNEVTGRHEPQGSRGAKTTQ